MEGLRDLLDIQNDDAHRVLADCEGEMAVYNAIRNGVKSGELSVEPPRRRASRPGDPGNLVPALPVVFLRYRPKSPMCQIKNEAMAMIRLRRQASSFAFSLTL